MSNNNSTNDNQPENSRERNQLRRMLQLESATMCDCMQQANNNQETTKYPGHIDQIKSSNNVRILSMNAKGCNPNNVEKIATLEESIREKQIDIALLNEVNTKWNAINVDKIEKQMKKIDRGALIATADSKRWEVANSNYLLGGLLSVFFSKCRSVILEKEIKIGRLGN